VSAQAPELPPPPVSDGHLIPFVTKESLLGTLKAYVPFDGLLKVLGGAFGVLVVVGLALAGWTVKASANRAEGIAAQLKSVEDKAESVEVSHRVDVQQLRREMADGFKLQDQKLDRITGLILDGTVRINNPRGSITVNNSGPNGPTVETEPAAPPAPKPTPPRRK
jgi:hypothetical protein